MSTRPFNEILRSVKTYEANYNYQYKEFSNEEAAAKYLRKKAADRFNKKLLIRVGKLFM